MITKRVNLHVCKHVAITFLGSEALRNIIYKMSRQGQTKHRHKMEDANSHVVDLLQNLDYDY